MYCTVGYLMLFYSSAGVMLYTNIDWLSVIKLHNDYYSFRSNCRPFSRISDSRYPFIVIQYTIHSKTTQIFSTLIFLWSDYDDKRFRWDINAPVKWLCAPYPFPVIKAHVDSLQIGEGMTCGHSVWWLLHVACITGPWSSRAEITDTSIDFSITLF